MADRRVKGIKQGLPGGCNITNLRNIVSGDVPQWSSSLNKWEIKPAASGIDVTANYDWTGTHTFNEDVYILEHSAAANESAALYFERDATLTSGNMRMWNENGQLTIQGESAGVWKSLFELDYPGSLSLLYSGTQYLFADSSWITFKDDWRVRVERPWFVVGEHNNGYTSGQIVLFPGQSGESTTFFQNDDDFWIYGYGSKKILYGSRLNGTILYYANAAKIECTTNGVDVTGDVYIDGTVKNLDQYTVIAYGSFNGADATPTLANDFGVDSLTDNGTGDYTINLTDSFSDDDNIIVSINAISIIPVYVNVFPANGTDDINFKTYASGGTTAYDSVCRFVVFKTEAA